MVPVCPLAGCGEIFRQNRTLLSVLPSSFFFYFSIMFSCFLDVRKVNKNTVGIRFLVEHCLA